MYKISNKVYADAGRILIGDRKIGYIFEGELEDFKEESICTKDMHIEGNFVVYFNGKCRELYSPYATYEEYKARLIKKIYSYDDQIAIMLNNGRSEQDNMAFEKMQEWRDWAGALSKKILELRSE